MKNLRILNLPLELPNLEYSKRYGYSMSIGLEDAFRAAGADVLTIPALSGWPPDAPPGYWLAHLRSLIAGQRFDQVWIEAQYSNYTPDLLDFLTAVAPVRVGLMTESRVLLPGEHSDFFSILPRIFDSRLPYLTHVLFPDERDALAMTEAGAGLGSKGPRAVFLPIFVNEAFIEDSPPPPDHDRVTFLGRLLRDRKVLLSDPALHNMIEVVEVTGEEQDHRLQHFDAMCRFFAAASQAVAASPDGMALLPGGLQAHVEALRSLKTRSQWIMNRVLQRGIANLNLRSFSALFSSRVFESIAAGQCVISYRVPDRPRTNGLFSEGDEILFFDDSQPESLAEVISRLRRNPDERTAIIRRSQAKLRAYHTTEKRVAQLLHWIETGDEPRYG